MGIFEASVFIAFGLNLFVASDTTDTNKSSMGFPETCPMNDLQSVCKDPRMAPPTTGGGPLRVQCQLHLDGISSVDESRMDFTVSLLLRETWNDPRLAFDRDLEEIAFSSAENMWIPDTYFTNEKSSFFHTVTVPNRMVRIRADGSVLYSVRVTVMLACQMNLAAFPLDTQDCYIKIANYAHNSDEVVLTWMERAIDSSAEISLPQYDVEMHDTRQCTLQFASTGNFSCLVVHFKFRRLYGYFLLQTYLPSVLIVIVSWVSFWINIDAVPARISLGVTAVLTLTTQLTSSSHNIPKVSYSKAIDVWLNVCMLFVFAALIEYAIINGLQRHQQRLRNDSGQDYPGACVCGQGRDNIEVRIDRVSRVLFPVAFVCFNAVYWGVYLHGW